MSEREYPREWYRVSRWGTTLEARTFVRETAAKLVCEPRPGRERMVAKETGYDKWYPTREEAEARCAEIAADAAAERARRRLRDAAPELLEALEDFCLSAESGAGCNEGVSQDDAYSEILSFGGSALASSYAKARAAIAKARATPQTPGPDHG